MFSAHPSAQDGQGNKSACSLRLETNGALGGIMEKEVNVYLAPGSPDTGEILQYLESKRIDFNVYDIKSDVKAHKRMLEAARGACSAPVIEIGNRIVCGFDVDRLEGTIKKELH